MLINLHALARASGRVLVAQSSDPGLGAPYQGRPRSVKNSQARTGHQRGMGGRWTGDDDTHERHTDTKQYVGR